MVEHTTPTGQKIEFSTFLYQVIEILYCTKTANYFLGLNTAEIRILLKKASNKSCSELNFIQKSPRAHMSISPQSGARGLKR